MVMIDNPTDNDLGTIQTMVRSHTNYTGSTKGFAILNNWDEEKHHFQRVISGEYKRILEAKEESFVLQQKAS
ncbi:MAG: glutamate synthase domain-containing protein 3 [Halioglobus sp.]|jgi:glutamate synthase domain-containing protein 3